MRNGTQISLVDPTNTNINDWDLYRQDNEGRKETHLGPVSEKRLSENSEYVNPEMRETLGFLFQNGRFVKPEKAGKSSRF